MFGELLKRGVVPYVPLFDEGVDALVWTAEGIVIEIQVKAPKSAGGKNPRWFPMGHLEPRKNFMIVGVEFEEGNPTCAWVLPSIIYAKYSSTPPKGFPRDLNLDPGARKYGLPFKGPALRIS